LSHLTRNYPQALRERLTLLSAIPGFIRGLFSTMKIVAFIPDCGAVDRVINHLGLTFIA
jgi:hypothetical protein